MDYNKYQYLWPPRPENKIPRGMLNFYESRGFIAQLKKNGTYIEIYCNGDQVIYKTRHNDDHKAWTPQTYHDKFFKGMKGWNVFCGELLHSKVVGLKNMIYLHDILVHNSEYLVGETFNDRQKLLRSIWPKHKQVGGSLIINEYFSMAVNYTSDFDKLFDTLGPEDEGLVLKDPEAALKLCTKETANSGWQVKCRIPHKNYGF